MTDDTTDELIRATYSALCKHGYAGLTMQDIADESTKSKAALHYHYDTKQDLLLAFLAALYEDFTERLRVPENDDPAARLATFTDRALTPPERDDQRAFQTAILAIKAQVPYDDAFGERIAEFDAFVHDQCRTIVVEGIEQGVFRDVDPDRVATFLVTLFNGAHVRWVTEGQPAEVTRELFVEYVRSQLLVDGSEAAAE
jgi:AcrR family transcriptional regulator